MPDADDWLSAYARAWEQADSDAVVELFTSDATYRSSIFREPHAGAQGIRAYWDRATSTQSDVRVRLGAPIVDGDMVAAEWWTTMSSEGDAITLPGVLVLHFQGDRCDTLREYWHSEAGMIEPPEGWGTANASGSSAEAGVRRWADGWMSAWPVGDVDAIEGIVSEDMSYSSHPFREPFLGRVGVRQYVEQAFDEESEVQPRFAAPIVAGSSAAVEYWATMQENGEPVTLAGCGFLSFDPAGRAQTLRDYWHIQSGTHDPPYAF